MRASPSLAYLDRLGDLDRLDHSTVKQPAHLLRASSNKSDV